MDFFFEKFFEASRARWWQVVAAICIGGACAAAAAWEAQPTVTNATRFAMGGGAVGLLAAVFLLWIDAGQRARETRGDIRLTLRERFMIASLLFAFAMAGISLLSCAFMSIVQAIGFLSRL